MLTSSHCSRLKYMKKDTHPTYFPDAQVICACGNAFQAGSTVKEIQVELCSNCHPFYTGKQKLVDTARRIEKFQERSAKKSDAGSTKKAARKTNKKDAK